MAPLLERKLIVITGKGGAGKTTIACALGLLAARRKLRAIVVQIGDRQELFPMFGRRCSPVNGVPAELDERLHCISLDPDKALIEWVRRASGRVPARMLASSSTFQYFAAAAPGAKELVSLVTVRKLCEGGQGSYDVVILDAPASGHALAMLAAPRTFTAIVRSGPLAAEARGVRQLLEDPRRVAYVAVAHASDMAVAETLDLEQGLRRELDRDLDAVMVNGVMPRRFTREELDRIARLDERNLKADTPSTGGEPLRESDEGEDARLVHSAVRAARTAYERARLQQSQIARLRRQRFAHGAPPSVIGVPLMFVPELDLDAAQQIAAALDRKL